jgi:hypothetical protein
MVDFAALNERNRIKRENWQKFLATELGAAFNKFEKATIACWKEDLNNRIPASKMDRLDKEMKEARGAFLELLMDLPR